MSYDQWKMQDYPAEFTGLSSSLGWMTGFEPATSGSTIRRSNQLSYTHHGRKEGTTYLLAEV